MNSIKRNKSGKIDGHLRWANWRFSSDCRTISKRESTVARTLAEACANRRELGQNDQTGTMSLKTLIWMNSSCRNGGWIRSIWNGVRICLFSTIQRCYFLDKSFEISTDNFNLPLISFMVLCGIEHWSISKRIRDSPLTDVRFRSRRSLEPIISRRILHESETFGLFQWQTTRRSFWHGSSLYGSIQETVCDMPHSSEQDRSITCVPEDRPWSCCRIPSKQRKISSGDSSRIFTFM